MVFDGVLQSNILESWSLTVPDKKVRVTICLKGESSTHSRKSAVAFPFRRLNLSIKDLTPKSSF